MSSEIQWTKLARNGAFLTEGHFPRLDLVMAKIKNRGAAVPPHGYGTAWVAGDRLLVDRRMKQHPIHLEYPVMFLGWAPLVSAQYSEVLEVPCLVKLWYSDV